MAAVVEEQRTAAAAGHTAAVVDRTVAAERTAADRIAAVGHSRIAVAAGRIAAADRRLGLVVVAVALPTYSTICTAVCDKSMNKDN